MQIAGGVIRCQLRTQNVFQKDFQDKVFAKKIQKVLQEKPVKKKSSQKVSSKSPFCKKDFSRRYSSRNILKEIVKMFQVTSCHNGLLPDSRNASSGVNLIKNIGFGFIAAAGEDFYFTTYSDGSSKITDTEYQAKYIESLSNYQNGEWNLSLDGFKFLIQADGNNQLADNCQYWIGEIYYSQKDFRRSIKEFEKVFTFPGTNKSDDAQFKLGLCYVNIGQIDKAKQEFENLLEFYPNSEYYKKGQDYLRQY